LGSRPLCQVRSARRDPRARPCRASPEPGLVDGAFRDERFHPFAQADRDLAGQDIDGHHGEDKARPSIALGVERQCVCAIGQRSGEFGQRSCSDLRLIGIGGIASEQSRRCRQSGRTRRSAGHLRSRPSSVHGLAPLLARIRSRSSWLTMIDSGSDDGNVPDRDRTHHERREHRPVPAACTDRQGIAAHLVPLGKRLCLAARAGECDRDRARDLVAVPDVRQTGRTVFGRLMLDVIRATYKGRDSVCRRSSQSFRRRGLDAPGHRSPPLTQAQRQQCQGGSILAMDPLDARTRGSS
jgi:hypothetical protein